MNLTKAHKEDIVWMVMQDTPRRHKLGIKDRLQAVVDEAITKRGPKGVAHLWKDKVLGQYLNLTSTNAGYLRPKPDARYESDAPYVSFLFGYELPDSDPARAEIAAIIEDHLDEHKKREQVRSQLSAALAGVRTRKQFIEQFPELEKYAPEEPGKDRTVPAIANVMAVLSTMGWPGDEPPAA